MNDTIPYASIAAKIAASMMRLKEAQTELINLMCKNLDMRPEVAQAVLDSMNKERGI